MKTSELTGADLAYWVARAQGLESPSIVTIGTTDPRRVCQYVHHHDPGDDGWWTDYEPHLDWAIGGPIIEKFKISIGFIGEWFAREYCAFKKHEGSSALEAAMRCLVYSNFGDEVPDNIGGGEG